MNDLVGMSDKREIKFKFKTDTNNEFARSNKQIQLNLKSKLENYSCKPGMSGNKF